MSGGRGVKVGWTEKEREWDRGTDIIYSVSVDRGQGRQTVRQRVLT